MTIQEWVYNRRKELGLTQMVLSKKLGVNQGTISGLENGKLPDNELFVELEKIFGKYTGTYTPPTEDSALKKAMPSKAQEALKAYREAKENGFRLVLEKNLYIEADRNQYILKQGTNASYFCDIKSLLKYLVVSQVRTTSIKSVQEIVDKLDQIYALIEKKFDGYDPANIADTSLEIDEEDSEEELEIQ